MELDEDAGKQETSQTETFIALEAFRSDTKKVAIEERGSRITILEVWLNKSISEGWSISDIMLLAIACWEEVCEVSRADHHHCAPQLLCLFEKISTVIGKTLEMENTAGADDSQFKALWHLFMCASGCIHPILASAAEVPQDSSTTMRLISAALENVHMSFLSPRWLEYVGNEQWIKVLEMHDALTKDIIEGIIIPGTKQPVVKKDHLELMKVVCRRLTATGIAMANIETKRYSVLKTLWVSICSVLNAVPESERARFATEVKLPEVIVKMVQNFHNHLSEGHKHNDIKSIKVAIFWLELFNRLMPVYRTSATQCWTFLVQTHVQLQHWVSPLHPHKEGQLPEILKGKVIGTFATVLVHLIEGMTRKELKVALTSLQEPFQGDDSKVGRMLTILQLCWKAAEMSPASKYQLLPSIVWMIKTFEHDFFQAYMSDSDMRNLLLGGTLTFFISASANAHTAEGNNCWKACEIHLLKLALDSDPVLSNFVRNLWGSLLRLSSHNAQKAYMNVYYKLLSDMAVRCISDQIIGDKPKQFAVLFGNLMKECHPEVQKQILSTILHCDLVDSIQGAASSCIILDSYTGQIADKGLASEWTALALEAIQKIRGALRHTLDEPARNVLQVHSFWLLKSIGALMRIFRMDGSRFQHGDNVATCVCQLLKGWDKLPESILRVSVEIIPLCSEELSHTEVSDVLPTLGKIIQKYAHMSEAVARLCEQRALAVPVSQEIFHFLLHHPHWLVLHHTLEALVKIGRQGDQNILMNLIPSDYRGLEACHPFGVALKAYLCRQHENPPCEEAVLTRIQGALSRLRCINVDISAIEASIRKLDINPDSPRQPLKNDWECLRALEDCIGKIAQEGRQVQMDVKEGSNRLHVLHLWLQEASRLQTLLNKEITAVTDSANDLGQ